MEIETLILSPFQTNTYLISKNGKVLVIDPADEGERIGNKLVQEGKEVSLIIATHAHPDHIMGVKNLRRIFPAPFYLHEEDLFLLKGDFKEWTPLFIDQEIEHPTHLFKDEETLNWEGEEIKILHTPGHTPGSIVIMIQEYLFSGDTLFCGSVGRVDLPGGDWEKLKSSLKKLFQIKGDYFIYPGHGPPTFIEEERINNPYVQEALKEEKWSP